MVGRRTPERHVAGTNIARRPEKNNPFIGRDSRAKAAWVDGTVARTKHCRVILGIDGSQSPVDKEREKAA